MNVDVGEDDARKSEVLAQDLLCYGGVQFAVDITLRSVLSCEGEAHAHAENTDGAMLAKARADKETACPELATSGRCKLMVMAVETGGRWSEESVSKCPRSCHARKRRKHRRSCDSQLVSCGSAGGHECSPSFAPQISQPRWSQHVTFRGATLEGRPLSWLPCLSQIADSFLRDLI